MVEGQDGEEGDWDNEVEVHMIDVCPIFSAPESWYRDLINYLPQGYFWEHRSTNKRRAL